MREYDTLLNHMSDVSDITKLVSVRKEHRQTQKQYKEQNQTLSRKTLHGEGEIKSSESTNK